VDNLKSKRHITPIITTTTQVMRDEEKRKLTSNKVRLKQIIRFRLRAVLLRSCGSDVWRSKYGHPYYFAFQKL
jgi:hypothetical protein